MPLGLIVASGPEGVIREPGGPLMTTLAVELPDGAQLRDGPQAPEIELPDGFRGFLLPAERSGGYAIEVWGDPGHPMRRPDLATTPAG